MFAAPVVAAVVVAAAAEAAVLVGQLATVGRFEFDLQINLAYPSAPGQTPKAN
jgi:hypothetical protein